MSAAILWWVGRDQSDDRSAANALGLACSDAPPADGFYLARDARGLALFCAGRGATAHPVRANLVDDETARRAGKRSLLARACGLHRHPPTSVFDATAGLGRDSAVLAQLGCEVTAVERHPVVYALLVDAHRRMQTEAPNWATRWPRVIHADATARLAKHGQPRPAIVLLDPMFDASRRRATPQKSMTWLHEIVGNDGDNGRLLAAARHAAGQRVVVKRHARDAVLAPPDLQFRGKAVRFDVYLCGGHS